LSDNFRPTFALTQPDWLVRTHQVAFGGLLLLLVWAPLPLASNRGWALALLSLCLCGLLLLVVGAAWLAGTPLQATGAGPRTGRDVWLPLGLLGAYTLLVALQLVPLPAVLLGWLAPGVDVAGGAGPLSVDPSSTRAYLLACVAYTAAFALVLLLARSERRLRWLVVAVVASGVFQAFLAVLLMTSRQGYEYLFLQFSGGGRATGTFASPDHLAAYMLLCIALGLGLVLSTTGEDVRPSPGWRHKVVAGLRFLMSGRMLVRLLLVTLVIALVLTRSRGGNGAFLAALLVTGGLVAWRSPQLRNLAVAVIVSMLVVDLIVIGQWVGLDKVVQRLEGTSIRAEQPADDGPGAVNVNREESLEERLFAARYALTMVQERPVLGFGGGTFYIAFPRFKANHALGFYDHAHNDYVEIAANTGLLGLGLLLTLAGAALVRALRALDDDQPPLARGLAAGIVMAIVSLAIHSVVDFNLQIPANALTFTIVLALAWCLPVRRRRRSVRGSGRESRLDGSKPGRGDEADD